MSAVPRIRPAAVAGAFYPADPVELAAVVDRLVAASRPGPGTPEALVAPHAGYVYSGPVAATAYSMLSARRDTIHRVVLLGPAHRVAVDGLAVPSVDAFETPLGPVAVDDEARARVRHLPSVHVDDHAHAGEHSLEVHLPFLQRILADFRVLPIVVGRARPDRVADVLDVLWDGPETLVVVSSDLSHYEDYDTAREHDRRTAAAICAGEPDVIGPFDACGAAPLRGLLEAAHRRDLRVELLDLRSSGDTAGDRSRVVGYGSFAVVGAAA